MHNLVQQLIKYVLVFLFFTDNLYLCIIAYSVCKHKKYKLNNSSAMKIKKIGFALLIARS